MEKVDIVIRSTIKTIKLHFKALRVLVATFKDMKPPLFWGVISLENSLEALAML